MSSVITAAKELGPRFRFVGLLPIACLGAITLALLWSGAPGRALDLSRLARRVDDVGAVEAMIWAAGLLVLALVVEPLQGSAVRLLSGRWGTSMVALAIAAPGRAWHRWRLDRLQQRSARVAGESSASAAMERRQAAAALMRYYPPAARVLPTLLGNILLAAEIRGGARYGLDTAVLWPRLYHVLPDRVVGTVNDLRNQFDLAARFCTAFITAAAVCTVILAPHGWWLSVPVLMLFLAALSYRSATAAAKAYTIGIETAFDLGRFALLRALHLPLPTDLLAEVRANQQLSVFLLDGNQALFRLRETGSGINFVYEHPVEEPSTCNLPNPPNPQAPSQGG